MNKRTLYFFIILLLLLNLFTLFKLNSLKKSVDNRFQQYEITESNRNNEINSIYSNVNTMLKKQASILDNYNVTYGALNPDNLTVPITFSITPKEYSKGLTASLQLNDKSIAMKKNGTSFIATEDAYIFDDFQLKVILNQNGVQKIETVEEYIDLQSKYLLNITGGFSGNSSYGSGKYQYDGELGLDIGNLQENIPEKVSIVKDVNGTIIDEQQINLSENISLHGEIAVKAGDKLTLYAHVKDKYGLNYKYIILTHEVDSKGEPVDNINNGISQISDKYGNILYKPKFNLEK